jgi:4'-phosphopantetheinyl transferase EntD
MGEQAVREFYKQVFSMKESVFKAIYSATGVALEFHDMHMDDTCSSGAFRMRLRAGTLPYISGVYGSAAGYVYSLARF